MYVGGKKVQFRADDLPHIEARMHALTHMHINAKTKISMCFDVHAVGEKVQYRADDLPHGLRDHSICQYMLAMNHSIPKCPQDKEIYAYYSSCAVSK
jgi:hypothetical protein